MSLFDAMNVSASGLTAQRLRMDTIAANLANANTTRTPDGEAYRRQMVVFESRQSSDGSRPGGGVRVRSIVEDQSPLRMVFDPAHPDANAEGYVAMPNVNPVTEMTDLISATRSYEANVTVVQALKGAASKALEI